MTRIRLLVVRASFAAAILAPVLLPGCCVVAGVLK